MFVTGAATDDFPLDAGLCKTTSPATLDMGMFEYSTFADSGNLTFTLKLFEYPESNAACQIGAGEHDGVDRLRHAHHRDADRPLHGPGLQVARSSNARTPGRHRPDSEIRPVASWRRSLRR